MTDITKYVQLKRIVAFFLDEFAKSAGDFHRAWVLGFRAICEIGLNIAFEPMTVRLPVNANMTVTFPSGYIKWTKIGVINASGEVSFLKINNSLTKWRDNNPQRLTNISPDTIDQDVSLLAQTPCFFNYYFGNMYTPYFGATGGGLITYGDCVVDEVNNVIVLQPDYGFPDVLLEYIGSPEMNEDYQIQIGCQEAVIAFIAWKFKVGTERDYYNRLTEARRKIKTVTLQEIQQAIRENQKYALKS